jgi:hypothetical protein
VEIDVGTAIIRTRDGFTETLTNCTDNEQNDQLLTSETSTKNSIIRIIRFINGCTLVDDVDKLIYLWFARDERFTNGNTHAHNLTVRMGCCCCNEGVSPNGVRKTVVLPKRCLQSCRTARRWTGTRRNPGMWSVVNLVPTTVFRSYGAGNARGRR